MYLQKDTGLVDPNGNRKRPAYYTAKNLINKIDLFTGVSKISLGSNIYAFEFNLPTKNVYILWTSEDTTANGVVLSGLTTNQVLVTQSVPDSNGNFTSYTMNVTNGQVSLNLNDTPIYIEEVQTYFEETDPAIIYAGTWNSYTCASCSGGTLKYSSQTGAKATFTFNGTGIKWIVTKASMLGKAKVRLDGLPPAGVLVDLYSLAPQFQVVLQKTGLAPGAHTLSIEVSGQKNPSSTGYFIDIDAFEVVP